MPLPGGLGGGAPGQGMPQITGTAPNPSAPRPERTGGTTMPVDPKGLLEAAKVNIKIAITLLDQSLPLFGSGSEEGGSIIKALSSLNKTFGQSSAEDLQATQLQNMFASMGPKAAPQGGGGMPPDLIKAMGG
jgi:hypothetical protein